MKKRFVAPSHQNRVKHSEVLAVVVSAQKCKAETVEDPLLLSLILTTCSALLSDSNLKEAGHWLALAVQRHIVEVIQTHSHSP